MSDASMKIQALYTIFEKHLYDFEDQEESQAAFIDKIVNDYIKYLEQNGVAVPKKWRMQIIEELRDQVYKMLVKKMYGCLSIKEYLGGQVNRRLKRKEAKKKYSKIL